MYSVCSHSFRYPKIDLSLQLYYIMFYFTNKRNTGSGSLQTDRLCSIIVNLSYCFRMASSEISTSKQVPRVFDPLNPVLATMESTIVRQNPNSISSRIFYELWHGRPVAALVAKKRRPRRVFFWIICLTCGRNVVISCCSIGHRLCLLLELDHSWIVIVSPDDNRWYTLSLPQ